MSRVNVVSWRGALLMAPLVLVGCLALSCLQGRCESPPGTHAGSGAAAACDELEGDRLAIRIFFRPLPKAMPGSQNDTPEMVALGRKLFFERGMSVTKSQSCHDCHQLDQRHAGTDRLSTSKGAKGSFGNRNAPTVLNAGFEAVQFWDGRAADLIEQAKGPVLNPIEMGMHSPEHVVEQLKNIKQIDYRRAFAAAFPNQTEPLTYDNVAKAIAAFERTLVTASRFDRYLQGQSEALTREEKLGLHRFLDIGCVECHSSHPVGGRLLQKLGVHHPYENQRDQGRFEVTHQEADRMVFKVPMLRNVTLTAPYFHDGQVSTLPEAVRLMAWMQLGVKLNPAEISEISQFLHALTAEQPLEFAGP